MHSLSNSQSRDLNSVQRLKYFIQLLALHVERLRKPSSFDWLASDIEGYREIFLQLSGQALVGHRVLEIGYGQRPFRLIAMQSLGYDACGVDLDQSMLQVSLSAVNDSIVRNGLYRTTKSFARRLVFDKSEYRSLAKMLASRYGVPLRPAYDKIFVGDASDETVWNDIGDGIEFVYSEDVFEHIPAERLPMLMRKLHQHMAPGGIAVITPNVFTGIVGGHGLDWYHSRVNEPLEGRSPPWGHLTGETPEADTYLNKLTRAQYRDILSEGFIIESEKAIHGDFGRQHLTPERRERLKDYSDDELFSNNVRFVLRKPNV